MLANVGYSHAFEQNWTSKNKTEQRFVRGYESAMTLEPGIRFGSYKVAESIGSGGIGEVWRATDTSLKRDIPMYRRLTCTDEPLRNVDFSVASAMRPLTFDSPGL